MAATAYASLVSLLNTLDQIHTHPLVSTFFDINQNKYLSEKVNFFVDFVEKYSDGDSKEVDDLVRRIADAAHEVENMMEVHAADRVRGGESPSFLHNLQKIMEKMVSVKEEVIKVTAEIGKSRNSLADLPSSSSSSSSSSSPIEEPTSTMVGFDDYVQKLWDDLIGHDGQQIISITGMGGIGKTTLARNLYENSHVMRHFNVRVWVTVSQESSARKVVWQALSCLGVGSITVDTTNDQQLSVKLHKTLFNRRYMIVLDDVWSVEIWDKIKLFFPENKNRSRIVVTTRESKLVDHIGCSALAVKFLDEEYSWKLFCEKTFPQQNFPPELEEVGKRIVKKCGGLPLAITVIGGFLGKSSRTQEYWEKIAKDKSLILNLGENSPLSILHLSYKYLPVCLKSCFLHIGLYPEDFQIDVSTIIRLWVAEGFIKADRGQSLEEVAESYFNDLVDRNLLLLHHDYNQSSKRCSAHDLVRDLSINIGQKENFFYVQSSTHKSCHFIADQKTRRFYPEESRTSETPSILDPLIVPGEKAASFKTRLLRVLCCKDRSPDDRSPYFCLNQEVSMRFLEDHFYNEHDYLLHSSVSRFWSLQTLIVRTRNEVVMLAEIWIMSQLRHIDIENLSVPPPPSDGDVYVLQNLQTLKSVQDLTFTEEVCKRIPNIKELDIYCDFTLRPSYHLENLSCFNKLESLNYACEYVGDSFQNIKFPSSLKELTLSDCKLEWSYMAAIASLPHLEYLNLDENAVEGTEWIFVDEKFVSLKLLEISGSDHVTKWIAQSSNFPVLEMLSICCFSKLDEIPSGLGEIPTLQMIYLDECSKSANVSAVGILYEQERFGNMDLRLLISTDEPELLEQKIEELDLTCQNLLIGCESYPLLAQLARTIFHF